MSFPAYEVIVSEIIARTADTRGTAVITIPTSLLKFLIQGRLPQDEFDEAAYLAAYPDIAQAVAGGGFINAMQHFLAHGYFEGRVHGIGVVDEDWYRGQYPDVAAAIASGAFADAADHYHRSGVFEWRAPNAGAVASLARWKAALSGAEPPLPVTTVGPELPLRPAAPVVAPPAAAPAQRPPDRSTGAAPAVVG